VTTATPLGLSPETFGFTSLHAPRLNLSWPTVLDEAFPEITVDLVRSMHA
jgi:hypothetical protein